MKTKFLIAIAVWFSLSSLTACNVSVTADVEPATITDALEGTITETPVTDNLVPETPIPETPVTEDDVVVVVEENDEAPIVVESNSFSLQIIDQNKTVLLSVEDGDSVDLSSLPDFFNIEAATSDDFDNVQFEVSSTDFSLDRTEGVPIWTMNPEDEGFTAGVGEYQITISGYTGEEITNVQLYTLEFTRSVAVEEVANEPVDVVVDQVVDLSNIDQSAIDNFFFSSSADLEYQFNRTYDSSRLPTVSDQEFYGVNFAFTGKSWIAFYIEMHKMTGDSKWLDYATTTINYWFSRTDAKLYERGELTDVPYYQAPIAVKLADDAGTQTGHIGWSIANSGGRRVEVLEDGVIIKAIMRFVDYVYSNNIDISSIILESWIDKCVAILESHDSEFLIDANPYVVGNYYYTSYTPPYSAFSTPLAFNHANNAASAMYLITKYRTNAEFVVKQHLLADFFMQYLTESGDHYYWAYAVGKDGQPGYDNPYEDVNHSSYNVDFMLDMYKSGYVSESMMTRIVRTASAFLTTTTCAHSINGSGIDDGGDRVAIYEGYLPAAQLLDSDIFSLIMNNLLNYADNTRTGFWHAQLANAATIANLIGLK